jgi:HK97 family phage portal protein
MAWYNFWLSNREEKLNPAQTYIVGREGMQIPSLEPVIAYQDFYENLEIVNRAVNMIVDDVAEVRVKVGPQTKATSIPIKGIKRSTVDRLLNLEPNPFQDVNTFYRNLIIDYIIDGNIFIYFDGVYLYHLPANFVVIEPDRETYIKEYLYQGIVKFNPDEIIHVRENSFRSIYRGTSRLKACTRSMKLLTSMRNFQDNFFKNGAVPGLVIKTPASLSPKIKERMLMEWGQRYRPDGGGRRPLILDGGMELEDITKLNFRDLDFESSIKTNEETILKALGVPPVLLDSGNNANLRPNHRLYYLETVIPIVRKLNFALERFFGFEIVEDVANIPALQPELQDQASFLSTLVNGGILSANEAREQLGKDVMPGHDNIRVPANIAGSAVDPSQGGRPAAGDTAPPADPPPKK